MRAKLCVHRSSVNPPCPSWFLIRRFAIILRCREQPMKFSEVIEQVRALLQRQGRISYRALKREFDLDDEYLEDLKAELIEAQRLASDEDGKVLVWVGASPVSSSKLQ